MASLGSYTRSAARATFSAYRSLPIRWRLAGGSAALTFVILAGFAAIVGVLTTRQLRGQFNDQVRSAADQLQQKLNHNHKLRFRGSSLNCEAAGVHLNDYASTEHAQIRIFDGGTLYCTQSSILSKGAKAPVEVSLFYDEPTRSSGFYPEAGYLVAVRSLAIRPSSGSVLVYARPLSDIDRTLARVRFFLLLGVIGGTVLALLAGLVTASRAMRPIRQLTVAVEEIERTRDPSRRLPHPEAEDDVAELARTLERMLQSLDAARGETQAMLDRQREFVADASHELRTPLTSVLANLELLTEELQGEQAETAQAALRSTRRMRRLVGDLLLLARADAGRESSRRGNVELQDVLLEAASELGPMAERHNLSVHARPVSVTGNRDDLHRLVLNLIENALRHTPPETHIEASTGAVDGRAVIVVQDDGPGIPPEIEHRMFERFVRGGRDGARGSGLGLSIVRAVAESHGGSVSLERLENGSGARFLIRLPQTLDPAGGAVVATPGPDEADQTSTTTGSTIGRRRSRS